MACIHFACILLHLQFFIDKPAASSFKLLLLDVHISETRDFSSSNDGSVIILPAAPNAVSTVGCCFSVSHCFVW
jgi:hypothetical protein